ncbi:hypothetical protein [Natronoglycomyces albus]|uniref:N-acetyltransferase domain-containing protein n=1 Tax=Natronoglycomyces albus TaxID=2811108 RepID=A0A895XYR3_9ACTN|nr:hypothetical protein [Natronoglycomyces albus]QSB06748.1 hypothetical protein JQS30_07630 [Natronoglycomyces albus]
MNGTANARAIEAVITAKMSFDFASASGVFSGAHMQSFGGTVATKLPELGHLPQYNKARGFGADELHLLPDIIDYYRESDLAAAIEVWEDDVNEEVATALRDVGLHPRDHLVTLHAPLPGSTRSHTVEVRETESDEEYLDILFAGYEVRREQAHFRSMLTIEHTTAELRRYLAFVEGTPAAAGALFMRAGTGLLAGAATIPQLRAKGCQSALIGRRMADAASAGCDLVVVTAAEDSPSHINLRRQFRTTHRRTVWR